jgi:hypothetical protein
MFRWRLAIGAVLIAVGYAAWLIITLVAATDLSPGVKTALTAFFGATPLLTKLIAIALLGRPTINFLKRHSFKLFRRDSAGRTGLLLVSPLKGHGYRASGLTTVAFPASVNRSFSSASRALARSIDSAVVSIHPAPMSSPVRTLPASISSSCCSRLACSCLHQAMKRSVADTMLPYRTMQIFDP